MVTMTAWSSAWTACIRASCGPARHRRLALPRSIVERLFPILFDTIPATPMTFDFSVSVYMSTDRPGPTTISISGVSISSRVVDDPRLHHTGDTDETGQLSAIILTVQSLVIRCRLIAIIALHYTNRHTWDHGSFTTCGITVTMT
jgi:hypothetical protein